MRHRESIPFDELRGELLNDGMFTEDDIEKLVNGMQQVSFLMPENWYGCSGMKVDISFCLTQADKLMVHDGVIHLTV